MHIIHTNTVRSGTLKCGERAGDAVRRTTYAVNAFDVAPNNARALLHLNPISECAILAALVN